MSNAERTSLMEQLAFDSPLSLRECCKVVREALQLPEFTFDCENETEWAIVEVDGLEYNLSRPYKRGTLHTWNEATPEGCNFGLILILYREHAHAGDHDWAREHAVKPVGESLSRVLETPVHHYQTWYGVGKHVDRDHTFDGK